MYLGDLSASVQLQLNQLRDGTATAANAVNARYANSASFASTAAALNGVAYTDFARLSQENTFSDDVMLSATSVGLRWRATGAATDQKRWRFLIATSGILSLDTEDDTGAFAENCLIFTRTGTNVDAIDINADALRWGGLSLLRTSSALDASNLLSGSIPSARVPLAAVSQHQASLSVASAATATTATLAATATNALALSGYAANENATPSTVVARTVNGYIYTTYFNQSSAQESFTPDAVFAQQGADGFLRKLSPALLGAAMDARNITGRTGTAKTLSASTPSGGSNGDIWYRY